MRWELPDSSGGSAALKECLLSSSSAGTTKKCREDRVPWEVGQSVHRRLTVLPAATGPPVRFAGTVPTIPPADQPPHWRSISVKSRMGPLPWTGRTILFGMGL